ncbi:hypothetical protein UCDDA912_g08539 [Diaporthe ampelina]|uniref:Uncharacterized protein n=1 Tax=Diaporthe ampelina TaxID=1214573 RepID=A0A0G2H8E5_9PEZI|nr:hypothetical protein UCDDA912_g08539 [Diaporthe ampelina]
MNPRLNPDLAKDDAHIDEKGITERTEVRLPVTNSLYGRPSEFVAAPDSPTTRAPAPPAETGGPLSAAAEPAAAQTPAHVADGTDGTDSTDAVGDGAEDERRRSSVLSEQYPIQRHDDEDSSERTALIDQFPTHSNTRDSGAVILESPIINHFVEKGGPGWGSLAASTTEPSSTSEAAAAPPGTTQAEAGETHGTAVRSGTTEPVVEGEAESEDATPVQEVATAFETPFETPFENPHEMMPSKELGAAQVPHSAAPARISEDNERDDQTISSKAPTVSEASAAVGEPLMDDVQLDVSDQFKPEPAVFDGPPEPLISDEQLDVDDDFKPRTTV